MFWAPMMAGITAASADVAAAADTRLRLLVTTDIGGDADDQQSMRRFMLYSCEFRMCGLIAASAGNPGFIDSDPKPELIDEIITDYGTVRSSLVAQATRYPNAALYPTTGELSALVKVGSEPRGVSNLVNSGTPPTEAAAWIITKVDESSEPLHIAIWGGAHDTAQAILSASISKAAGAFTTFKSKLRIYAIVDQDALNGSNGTVDWIRQFHQDVFLIENGPGADLGYNPSDAIPDLASQDRAFRGHYHNDDPGNGQMVPNGIWELNQDASINSNVKSGHGALGADYPLVVQNTTSTRNTSGMKEGDSPSWMYFLPNGLQDPEHPDWGGWGGRFQQPASSLTNYWYDALDTDPPLNNADTSIRRKWPTARWREHFMLDFFARMDWCVSAVGSCNHPPVAVLNGDTSKAIVQVAANGGTTVNLSAAGSSDPDGNTLSYLWFQYKDVGAYSGTLSITGATSQACSFTAPNSNTTVHLILQVRDNGSPNLTSYRRAVVTVTAI